MRWYSPDGKRISLDEAERLLGDMNALRVAQDVVIDARSQECRVSTVFLVLDHGHGGDFPVLWETMVFGGDNDMYQERYISRDAAVQRHQEIVQQLKEGYDFEG